MADLYLYVARTRTEVQRATRFLGGPGEDPTLLDDMLAVWLGTASWVKAELFDEPEVYVPKALRDIEAIVGARLPVIDEVLIEHVRHALRATNATPYPLAPTSQIVTFLDANQGHRIFSVRVQG